MYANIIWPFEVIPSIHPPILHMFYAYIEAKSLQF